MPHAVSRRRVLLVALIALVGAGLLPAAPADAEPSAAIEKDRLIAMIREAAAGGQRPRFSPAEFEHAGASLAERALVRKIRSARLSVSFDDWTVEDTIDFLRKAVRINIVVSARARKALREEKAAVKLAVTDLPLTDILDLLLTQLGAYRLTVRSGALLLVRAEEYRPRTTLRIYDIRDLITPRPDFPAPALGASLKSEDEEF